MTGPDPLDALRALAQQDGQAAHSEQATREQQVWDVQIAMGQVALEHSRAQASRERSMAALIGVLATFLNLALILLLVVASWAGIAYVVSVFR